MIVEVVDAEFGCPSKPLHAAEMTIELLDRHFSPSESCRPPNRLRRRIPLCGARTASTGAVIRFVPRFPLEPGLRYRAEFRPGSASRHRQSTPLPPGIAIAAPPDPTTLVAEYSPGHQKSLPPCTRSPQSTRTSDVLPENLLRFYISISAPMSRGEAYQRIKLLDAATGKPVESPFLELDEELWSPDGTRFTLLFDPGRVKRGLKPREELGPVLEAGKSYSLVIDADWPDATGNPLTAGFRKTFRVRPAR